MIMKTLFFLALLSHINFILSEEITSPQIVIVGAGPSGIAAGSKLYQNGLRNITILEAENRIGGRVYSVEMGEYLVDIGAQWVHGEEDNVAYELAWPLGLLEKFDDSGFNRTAKLFFSSGEEMSVELSNDLVDHHVTFVENIPDDLSSLKTGSLGEYLENRLNEYFKNHTEISAEKQKSLLSFLNLFEMALQAADSWHEVSAKRLRDSATNAGDLAVNWKNLTYATILKVLMNEYPDPNQAIPLEHTIMLNDKVTKINYDMSDGTKKLITKSGKEYSADHIIFTGSVGVLKADHEAMFDPPLPESKVKEIQNLNLGHVAKIYLYYENPWWNDGIYLKGIVWTESDRKEMENNPEKKWMLSIYGLLPVEHKPKLICVWLTGPYVKDMELTSEDVLLTQTKELFNKIFGHAYNLTEPSMLKRSLWYTNENFRGTYSYPSLETEKTNVYPENLAEPIMKDNKPSLQFAGEATAKYYGTVHGAISSGWREADRLINLYSKKE